MDKVISDVDLDLMDIDDEVDCAILDDEDFVKALESIEKGELVLEDEDEPTDLDIDYTDALVEPDMVSTDADDLLAAERDIAFDPFEDDDIMDSIEGSDEEIEVEDEDEVEDEVLDED